jgi:hypothetical protein
MSMQPWNMNFMIFFLSPRPFEELRVSLDEMFGGHFEQDLKAKADGVLRYTNYVFGLSLSCRFENSWKEGSVYRFSGTNDSCCRFDTLEVTDVAFHVHKLLDNITLTRIMTFEEFREESRRRNPQ